MTHNRLYNRCVIFALILIVGLGLALALPWLAKSQSLAADEKPNGPPDFTEVVHSAELAYALAVEGNGNAPTPPALCFATHNGGTDVFSRLDASALQEAVDAASPGDTVEVAGTCIGVEARAGLTQTVYISKSLTLEGGHTQSDWTLDPDPDTYTTLLHAYDSGRVIVISGTVDVTLDSLFLTGGLADDNTLDDNGGGIWSNSGMTLTNSIIYTNTANYGGGMYNLGVDPVLTNITFIGNSADYGGAMYNDGGFDKECSPSLTNVTFSGNSADNHGGAMLNYALFGISDPILTNVTFSGNSADNLGGAMYNHGISGNSSPSLTNVTFSGNSAGTNGGAMYNFGLSGSSSPVMRNSILWNNQANGVTGTITATIYNSYASITLTHSLVEASGGSSSWALDSTYINDGGNIDEDPMFILPVDPATAPTTDGNFRLTESSPAIDAGDNQYITVTYDLDNEARKVDGDGDGTPVVDMGAYETPIYYKYVYLPLINH